MGRHQPAVRLCLTLGLMGILVGCATTASKSASQIAADELSAGLRAQFQGRTAEAVDHYHNVLAHDAKNKFAYYNLGLIDQQAGNVGPAENEYRAALSIDPNFVEALFNLAILRTAPSPNEALDLYTKVVTLKPSWAAAHLNLGFVLLGLGKSAEAQAEFGQATHLDPTLASRLPSPTP